MPRFSIVVPSHGVAGRLPQALDSVLAQSFGDFELIPVCDAPDSPAADVVAGYAERDCRVTPVHSPPSAGLAGARNTGLRSAVGGHVLFLDGDDVLVPGALAALDARLGAVGDVDVLYFEHERTPWWEGEPTNPAAPLLAGTPQGAFSPGRTPRLTGVALPAWSAAYRRGFLTEHGLAFPGDHFTDTGFGGLVALRAERVAALRAVVVRHLLRRQGNRLNLPGEHHAELLDQTELVLTRAVELGLPADRLRPLFEQLFAAVLKTAAHPRRLPAGRRAFFRRAGALYRSTAPRATSRPAAASASSTGCWRPGRTRRSAPCAPPTGGPRVPPRCSRAPGGCAPACATRRVCAFLSTRTSSCTARTGAAATPATRPRSTPRPVNSPRTCARCSWWSRTRWTACRRTWSTR